MSIHVVNVLFVERSEEKGGDLGEEKSDTYVLPYRMCLVQEFMPICN